MTKLQMAKTVLIILASALTMSGIVSQAWSAGTPPTERTITVEGEGAVTAVPDQVEMDFSVNEEALKAEAASDLARVEMKKVLATLKNFGVAEKDIKTMGYRVAPKMKYDNGETKKIGYGVSNQIRVIVEKMDTTGKILDAVVQDGVADVDGPIFSFSDPTRLKLEALKAAVQDARSKAEAIAQSSGVGLGKVFSVTTTGFESPITRQPVSFASNALRAGTQSVPIAVGQNEVSARVEVVYSIK
ncbi:MAG: SIMPL domain-containing protein [bacterium]